ncbi:MAG: hypothetical protein U5K74_13000 [Gemmatimonadaceae bacterium]|nr:hypothetical protein [Gemmatimonadaceae bacterium]
MTNHNKMHALTIQYWEVLRKFASTTEVEGCTLVCFVPLDLVRFLPPGQPLELVDTTVVDTRAELLVRYAMLHRHADAIQPVACPGPSSRRAAPAGGFRRQSTGHGQRGGTGGINPDHLAHRALDSVREGVGACRAAWRPSTGPIMLDSPLTVFPPNLFGTRTEFVGELKRLRNEGAETNMTGAMLLPQTVDPSADRGVRDPSLVRRDRLSARTRRRMRSMRRSSPFPDYQA